jgi:hypothetical protein
MKQAIMRSFEKGLSTAWQSRNRTSETMGTKNTKIHNFFVFFVAIAIDLQHLR